MVVNSPVDARDETQCLCKTLSHHSSQDYSHVKYRKIYSETAIQSCIAIHIRYAYGLGTKVHFQIYFNKEGPS